MQRYVHALKHGLDRSAAHWAAAAETIVLASSEKLATASPYRIAGLSEISGIVLPAQTPAELLQPYRELGIALTLA